MALYKTRGVVIGRRAFGESDRLVDFYTRDHGKVRGIARSARRPRSRFGSALELFTLGEMVFFDSGRSELVQVDHFDIVRSFVGVREHLERLGQGAWAVEVVARLSADRGPQPALFGRLNLASDLDAELAGLLEGLLARLMGRYPLSSRFITQTRRVPPMVSLPER